MPHGLLSIFLKQKGFNIAPVAAPGSAVGTGSQRQVSFLCGDLTFPAAWGEFMIYFFLQNCLILLFKATSHGWCHILRLILLLRFSFFLYFRVHIMWPKDQGFTSCIAVISDNPLSSFSFSKLNGSLLPNANQSGLQIFA